LTPGARQENRRSAEFTMALPIRKRDEAPRSQVRPILPPRIDARTHLDVAQAYVEMGLLDEALFELSLIEGDGRALREAEALAADIEARRAPGLVSGFNAPAASSQPATRVEGLRPRSEQILSPRSDSKRAPASAVVDTCAVDDAIDMAFDECFGPSTGAWPIGQQRR